MSPQRQKPIRWLLSAREELRAIAEHIADDDQAAADRFVDRVLAKVDLLGDSPHLGGVCPYYRKARQLIHGKYLIYYTVHRAEVVIRAVVHGARLFHSSWVRRKD